MIAMQQFYLFCLIPIVIILVAGMFLALDKVLLLTVFCIPLSVPIIEFFPSLGFNVDIPTEPLFVSIMLIFILKLILERNYSKSILKHPLSIAIIIYLTWQLVTVFTSSMFLVSIKCWLSSLWFIIPFFYLGILLFKEPKNFNRFIFLYLFSFAGLIVYVVVRHSGYAFDQHIANGIMNPFFRDHTSYGAAIAMFMPFLIGFIFNKETKTRIRILSLILLAILVVGLIFSYTRAAWVSLIGALAMYAVLRFKINYKLVLTVAILAVGGFMLFQNQILLKMEGNKVESSTDFSKHIKSISNISSDASNLERINRWNCAIRMFEEKPVFGWGPGTYQFKYAPFQHSDEKTIISTNAGDGGNAHSEYLGMLASSGLLGMINYIIICIVIFVVGTKTYYKVKEKNLRIIVGAALCGLVTYFVHGLLNNFLDMDKIAVPFWGFSAMIVAIDLYYTKLDNKAESKIQQAETANG